MTQLPSARMLLLLLRLLLAMHHKLCQASVITQPAKLPNHLRKGTSIATSVALRAVGCM